MIDGADLAGAGALRRLLPYGEHAQLLECRDLADTQAIHRWLVDQRRPEILELVPGARTVLLRLSRPLPMEFVRTMVSITPAAITDDPGTVITIDVDYDGPDLTDVGDLLGLTTEDLVTHHTGQDWVVAFCGFAPGFGYLAAADHELRVPRLSVPRTRVPAGSVALADTWSAIYPTASPGGWRLIGSTTVRLFDVADDPPALLRPGSRVRFRQVRP